jgi:hypothetical protein
VGVPALFKPIARSGYQAAAAEGSFPLPSQGRFAARGLGQAASFSLVRPVLAAKISSAMNDHAVETRNTSRTSPLRATKDAVKCPTTNARFIGR